MFGLAGRINIDHRRPGIIVRFHDRFVKVVDMRCRGLRHVHFGMNEADLRQLLSPFAFPRGKFSERRHFASGAPNVAVDACPPVLE